MKTVLVQFIDTTGFEVQAEAYLNDGVLHLHTSTGAFIRLNWNYITYFTESDPK